MNIYYAQTYVTICWEAIFVVYIGCDGGAINPEISWVAVRPTRVENGLSLG